MQKIIGIGDMFISNNEEDTIKTFALASCVGVVAYSSVRKVGGIIHIALPKPPIYEDEITRRCYYASTGIPYFINKMCKDFGCLKGELGIRLYGGANSIRSNDVFNVGKKNLDAVKSILQGMSLSFEDKDVGNNISRTIELDIFNGQVVVSCHKIRI